MVTILTALIIQGNDTDISPYHDPKSKKWGYEVSRMERGNFRSLITCFPIYDSKEIALEQGEALVAEIRGLDLSSQRKGLGELLGDSKEIVQAVTDAARGSPKD